MCSRELQGDALQRKGGTSSQAGPLAATSPKVGAMPQEVTWVKNRGASQQHRGAEGDAPPKRGPPAPPGLPGLPHLHVGAAVAALAQGREGVGAVGGVEVGAGGDGVLCVLGGVAALAPRQRVPQVVVGPAKQPRERQGEGGGIKKKINL